MAKHEVQGSKPTPPPVLSLAADEAPKPKKGGPEFHKQPCKCRPCSARRREEKALAGPVGERSPAPPTATVVLNADTYDPGVDSLGRRKRNDRERSYMSRVAEWVKWRAIEPTMTTADIAKKIGISPRALYGYISRATKEGKLKFEDPFAQVEHEIMPMIAENVKDFLAAKDRTVTIEAAKSVLFPLYKESKGVSEAPKTILALKLEAPPGDVKLSGGIIMGTPKVLPVTDAIDLNLDEDDHA